jgi:cell shape-determining protein MreC
MAAVYPGGLAGRLQTPGITGTRIRLITDKGFGVTGVFARYISKPDGHTELVRIATDPPLVRGDGNNALLIDGMSLAKAKEIKVNDVVLLEDTDGWPIALQGQPIGRVIASPAASRHAPGFAEIHLQPAADLMRLREIMIVTKAKY